MLALHTMSHAVEIQASQSDVNFLDMIGVDMEEWLDRFENPETCWVYSYNRSDVTYPAQICPPGKENIGGLCYQNCRGGYTGIGSVCWEHCPSGTTDVGITCWHNDFWKGAYNKKTYVRNTSVPGCHDNDENILGICHNACEDGFTGVGSPCYDRCPHGKK